MHVHKPRHETVIHTTAFTRVQLLCNGLLMYTLCRHHRLFAGDVKAIAAGYAHSLALKTNGTVWATGRNNFGQLGDGSNTDKNKFVRVIRTWDTTLGNTLSTCTTLSVRLQQTLAHTAEVIHTGDPNCYH